MIQCRRAPNPSSGSKWNTTGAASTRTASTARSRRRTGRAPPGMLESRQPPRGQRDDRRQEDDHRNRGMHARERVEQLRVEHRRRRAQDVGPGCRSIAHVLGLGPAHGPMLLRLRPTHKGRSVRGESLSRLGDRELGLSGDVSRRLRRLAGLGAVADGARRRGWHVRRLGHARRELDDAEAQHAVGDPQRAVEAAQQLGLPAWNCSRWYSALVFFSIG